jgi:general secretion pathway protein D
VRSMKQSMIRSNVAKRLQHWIAGPLSLAMVMGLGVHHSASAQEPPPPPPPELPNEEPDNVSGGDFSPPPPPEIDSKGTGSSSGAALPKAPPKAPSKKIPPGQEMVSIDFPDATSLKDIIKAVSSWTGKNFILGQGVSSSAKVSIISPQQVTKEEAYQAFLSALNVAGYTTVDTGKAVKIVSVRQATSSNIKTFYGSGWTPMTDEIITQIIPLQFIDAQTVANQLRTILRESNPVPFQTTNSLIVSDTGHKIRRLLEIIKLLDVKANQPQVAILVVKHTDANDIAKKVQDVFGTGGRGSALYLQKVIVDERSNSLILIGPPRGLDDVARLVGRLDRPLDDLGSQTQIHVRPLDYADAEKLAATLQALAQGVNANRNQRRPGAAGATLPPSGASSVADLGNLKITADKATNSLILQGSKAAFNELEGIIKQLDKRRDQVYVEADIIDVNIGNQMSLATSFLAGATGANGSISAPLGWKPGGMAPFAITQTNPNDTQKAALLQSAIPSQAILGVLSNKKVNVGGIELSPGAFLFALKTDSNSNVLQTPSLLVADNEESTFDATERENILVTQEDATTKIRTQKYEPLDATLSLKLKPQISKADFVNMELTIKAESFGRRNSENRPEQTNKRTFSTKITAENSQTIMLSGLQRDLEIEGKDKVPLLGDIPIIGWLFRNSSNTKSKTNLMFFITPHVVRDSVDLQKIYERKVKARDEFLSAFYGKDFRKKDVFQRLPDIKDGKAGQGRPVKPNALPGEGNGDAGVNGTNATEAKADTGGASALEKLDGPSSSNVKLPSQDPNPIVVPGASGGGSSFPSGGNPVPISDGGSNSAPPPPPPPVDAPAEN